MAEIRPFPGIRYSQQIVGEIADVICPPYDIISPRMVDELYQKSPYNFIRVEFAREQPQDNAKENRYKRAAATLEHWLAQGILRPDGAPAIYIHDHIFSYRGREWSRRGLIVRVRLEEWDRMIIRPHEGTLSQPKSDRLNLLWALQANTSPILGMYEDPARRIAGVLKGIERTEPLMHTAVSDGERHIVRAVTDSKLLETIKLALADQPIYIADGHHRYESALTYRRQKLGYISASTGEEPFNFVMMTIIDFSDPGMVILPPHRLVRGISKAVLEAMPSRLRIFFVIEEWPIDGNVWQRLDSVLCGDTENPALALYGLEPGKILILRLKDFAAASQMMPYFHSELYKRLDVSIVDHIVLEKVLEMSSEREEVNLGYTHSLRDAIKKVEEDEYQLSFLLSPVKARTVKAIADAGDRMPRKSTYFYPKPPAGLVVHRLV